ncbi:MAG: Hpt domain-containing protein [Methylobacterium sp.]|nr:MAG: Hpt domain-containing protein [Methylobacterium sp.]
MPSVYEQVTRYLQPNRLGEVLRLLVAELRTSFLGDAADPDVRTALRHRAHSLSSASGMLGFMELSRACHALEGCGEDRVEREGRDGFGVLLGRVRTLAGEAMVLAVQLARGIEGAEEPTVSTDCVPRH